MIKHDLLDPSVQLSITVLTKERERDRIWESNMLIGYKYFVYYHQKCIIQLYFFVHSRNYIFDTSWTNKHNDNRTLNGCKVKYLSSLKPHDWSTHTTYFSLIFGPLIKRYNFYNNIMWKMSIQYPVLGLKPTTFWRVSSPITTRPGLPLQMKTH